MSFTLTVGLLFSVVTVSTASQDGAVSNVSVESISSGEPRLRLKAQLDLLSHLALRLH